jgi:hypothetical protein
MKLLCLIQLVLLSFFASAQRDIELIFPSAVHIGASVSKLERDSASIWSQGIGSAVVLNTGIGGLYKKKLGCTVQAGLAIGTYSYSTGTNEYSISSLTTTAFINSYYLFRIKQKENPKLHIGSDFGWNFYSFDEMKKSAEGFNAVTRSYGPRKFFIAPEVGITAQHKRMALSVLGTYGFQFKTDSVLSIQVTDPNGGFSANSKMDYLGLKIRFTYTLAGHKEPTNEYKAPPSDAAEMQARKSNEYQIFNVNKRTVKLVLWDNGEIDNDSISVVLNGQYVLTNYRLTKDKKKLKIRLHSGSNQFIVMAHNEGTIPPNTAQCKMICGRKKWDFAVSCGLKANAGIEILVAQ